MAARAPRIETRERRLIGRIAIAATLALVLLGLRTLGGWATIDGRAFDILSTVAPPAPAHPGAVVIAIDEPSFSALQRQWPWPRDIHATLIARLRAAGVKAIGFDIVFADPSDPAADATLGRAAGRDTSFAVDETLNDNAQASTLIRTEPLPELLVNGARAGVASVSLDGDGVLRRMPTYLDSLAAMIARTGGIEPAKPGIRPRMIQYFGPAGSYPRISYYQALEPEKYLPPNFLRGRTVIIGYSLQVAADLASGTTDAFETPYTVRNSQLTPGVEVQATILDNLTHGLSISTLPPWIDQIAIIVAAVAAFLLARSVHPSRKALFALLAIIAMACASWLLLRYGRIWFSPVSPSLAILFIATGLAIRDYALERRLRHDVQGAFAQYLAPTLIERMIEDPSLLKLGGEAREMTILFADIRGFTTISESMKGDPQALVRMINSILAPLSDVVVANGGTIDKYMGDCVMAFWNAPLDDPDHAANAVRAALGLVAALAQINETLRKNFGEGEAPSIRLGVGVNSGRCVVGNMGSEQRFDYSVLGDAVNVASRLEASSKSYGLPIILGETTAKLVGDRLPLLQIDCIAVRGKTEMQAVYTVLTDTDIAAIDLDSLYEVQDAFLTAVDTGTADSVDRARMVTQICPFLSSYTALMLARPQAHIMRNP